MRVNERLQVKLAEFLERSQQHSRDLDDIQRLCNENRLMGPSLMRTDFDPAILARTIEDTMSLDGIHQNTAQAFFHLLDMILLFNYLDKSKATRDLEKTMRISIAGLDDSLADFALASSEDDRDSLTPKSAKYASSFVDQICTDPIIAKAVIDLLKTCARKLSEANPGTSPKIDPRWDTVTDLRQIRLNVIEGFDFFPVNNIFGCLNGLSSIIDIADEFNSFLTDKVWSRVEGYLTDFKQSFFDRMTSDISYTRHIIDQTLDLTSRIDEIPIAKPSGE